MSPYHTFIFSFGLLFVFTTGLLPTRVSAQRLIKDYVTKNAVTLQSAPEDSADYKNLESIGNAIGDAKIVMLGEQDHGDAPTFLAKASLVKFLHEKKGFNVLAFESDFFALNYGWDHTPKQSPVIDTFILKNIFSVWTTCDACTPLLFKYIPATYHTPSPLMITGFDSQQYLNFSYYNMPRILDSILRIKQLPIIRQANYQSEILPTIDSIKRWSFFYPKDTNRVEKGINYLRVIREQLGAKLNSGDFWLYVLDNEIHLANEIKEAVKGSKAVDKGRDLRMAMNLKWLMENKFKGQKIIVWAADVHLAKNINISKFYPEMTETMGGKFMESIANPSDVYTIGFTSAEGMAGRVGSPGYRLIYKTRNSFESWFTEKQAVAFVDFKAFNKLNPGYNEMFYATPITHVMGLAQWNQAFDGLIHIKNMYRCNPTRPMKILSFFGQ